MSGGRKRKWIKWDSGLQDNNKNQRLMPTDTCLHPNEEPGSTAGQAEVDSVYITDAWCSHTGTADARCFPDVQLLI